MGKRTARSKQRSQRPGALVTIVNSMSQTICTASFRFYGELSLFLAPARRQTTFAYTINPPVSVKHVIEALGAPHTEVETILVNGIGRDFDYLLQAEDRVTVLPARRTLTGAVGPALRPPWPDPPLFLADNHLGRLARFLRLVGCDVWYEPTWDDAQLADTAGAHGRILLTRDRHLLKRSQVVFGYCLHALDPRAQLVAVVQRFGLAYRLQPWTRCLRCNGLLNPVAKADVWEQLEPKTRLYFETFQRCGTCGQVYWPGSHTTRLAEVVALAQTAGKVVSADSTAAR